MFSQPPDTAAANRKRVSQTNLSPPDASFVNLVLEAQRGLNAYILTLVPNLADADDILQETNSTLLRKAGEFEQGTRFWSWACRVAYYEVLAFRKRRQRDRVAIGFDEKLLETIGGEAAGLFADLDKRLLALDDCLGRLKEQDRQLVALRYRDDQNAGQIAGVVGRTVRAVYQALYRIRHDLAQCVKHKVTAMERER